MKTRSGFTLVELMVVIVVLGLLAAIGVPKLMGSIAKSRAAEVMPAASSYIKLQKAYMSEKRAVGTWKSIGYVGPGTQKFVTEGNVSRTTYVSSNFVYDEGNEITTVIKKSQLKSALENSPLIGWIAENSSSLNGCAKGNKWVVRVKYVNDTTVQYVPSEISSSCAMLVSNWNQTDLGSTFGDDDVGVAVTVDPPDDIALTTEPEDDDEEPEGGSEPEGDVTPGFCHSNGWLQGYEKGWAKKPEGSWQRACYDLRGTWFDEGKLICQKGEVATQDKCNGFSYSAEGASELLFNGKEVVCSSLHSTGNKTYCKDWMLKSNCAKYVTQSGMDVCQTKKSTTVVDGGDSPAENEGETSTEGSVTTKTCASLCTDYNEASGKCKTTVTGKCSGDPTSKCEKNDAKNCIYNFCDKVEYTCS